MQLAQSVQVSGFSLFGPAPIGALHVSTDSDWSVTTLYGLNGAGKSRVMKAMRLALSGVATESRAFAHLDFTADFLGWSTLLFTDFCGLVDRCLDRSVDDGPMTESNAQDRDEIWSGKVESFRTDLARLARGHDAFGALLPQSVSLTIEAVGTASQPAWDVYVSSALIARSDEYEQIRLLRDPEERAAERPWTPEVVRQNENTLQHEDTADPQWARLDLQLHNYRSRTTRPEWVPARLRYLGRLDIGWDRIAIVEASASAELVELESREIIDNEKSDAHRWPSDDQQQVMTALSRDASDYASALFGVEVQLTYRVQETGVGSSRRNLRWYWTDEFDRDIPISETSSGQQMMASTAIATANGVGGQAVTAIVFFDEPERSLHPQAIARIADGVRNLSSVDNTTQTPLYGIVFATHAPVLVNPDRASVVHIDRQSDGEVRANQMQFEQWSEPKQLAEQLGWTAADVLQKIRKWVVVEGRHDVAVIGTIFQREFAERSWALAPMHGAQQISSALTSRFVLDFSDASIRIVLDHLDADHVELFREAKRSYLDGDDSQARRVLNSMNRGGSTEVEHLSRTALEAVGRRTLDRIEVVGLQKPDILNYLDPTDLGLKSTWSHLLAEFQRSHPGRMDGRTYKEWLKQQGMRADPDTLCAAARNLDDLSDLASILA